MNFDELKHNWEKEMNTPATVTNEHIKQAQKTDNKLKRAFNMEIFSCFGVFIFCIWSLIFKEPANVLMLLSYTIAIAMSAYVPYRLIKARKAERENDWTLRNNIDREIEKFEKQKKLLSSVATWYVAPLAVAIFLGSWGVYAQRTGTYIPDFSLIVYWVVAVALGAGIIFWNKYSAKKNIEPSLKKLQELKNQLEE